MTESPNPQTLSLPPEHAHQATTPPTLQIFAHNLPRFASDFAIIPNHWSKHGGRVRLHAPMPAAATNVWWADREVIDRARRRLSTDIEIAPLPFDRHDLGLGDVIRAFRWAQAVAKRFPDGLFVFWTILPIILLGVPFRLRNRRCVFMLTGLGSVFASRSRSGRLVRAVVGWFLGYLLRGRNSRVITHNHEDKEYLVSEYGIAADRIMATGGCGIDPDEFPFRERWPVNSPRVVLVPVRLLEEKGVRDAASASGLLDARGVEHEMWFSSTFDEGNPGSLSTKDVQELERRYPCVRFIGYQPEMPKVFEASDIVCVPTWYREGLPTALLEAASTGRPLVTTDNVGGREFIRDGQNGLLVPPREPAALADALESLITDSQLADRLRRIAFRDFLAGYTKQHMLERTLEIVSSLGVTLPVGASRGEHLFEGFDRTNIWDVALAPQVAHGGKGRIGFRRIVTDTDVSSPLNFIDVAELAPGVSIGVHRHRENEEEFYLVLRGTGTMRRDAEEFRVQAGDLVRNPAGGEHSLVNDGKEAMRLLVFEAKVGS